MYRTWQGGAEIAAIVIFVSILVMDHFEAGCIWSVSTLNGLGVDLWWLAHWPQNTEYWPMWHITVIQEHVHSISHNLLLVHYPYVLLWNALTALICHLSFIRHTAYMNCCRLQGREDLDVELKNIDQFLWIPTVCRLAEAEAGAELWAALTLWQ